MHWPQHEPTSLDTYDFLDDPLPSFEPPLLPFFFSSVGAGGWKAQRKTLVSNE
jgi:hypothetical protein